MATKKKSKNKTAKKKVTKSKLPVRKKIAPPKKSAKKSTAKSARKRATKAHKKSTPKTLIRGKAAAPKTNVSSAKPVRERREAMDESLPGIRRAPEQSSDLRGASRAELADSESVNELLDEGNTFEAGAVAGVEDADNADEREVHTREVLEDDVPEEYLDKD